MNVAVPFVIRLYTRMLHLYPTNFRDEFAEEMTAVFIEALSDVQQRKRLALLIWCGWELTGLFAGVVREQWHSLRREEAVMSPTNPVNHTSDTDQSERETPLAILAGIFPFVLFGLSYVLKGVNYHAPLAWLGRGTSGIHGYLGFIVLGLVLIGLGIGWAQRFPRWSYAYLGVTVASSVLLADTATPGLRLFGYTFGREQWGWRAWLPLLALIGIMLLRTRSLQPVRQLFVGMWQDWTQLSFFLYGALTWLIIGVSYDNKSWYNNTIYLPLNMFLLTLVFTGGAFFYMYCRWSWQRVVALQLAIILYPPVSAAVEALDGNNFFASPDSVLAWLFLITIWFGVMFMPGALGLVHRAVRNNHFV